MTYLQIFWKFSWPRTTFITITAGSVDRLLNTRKEIRERMISTRNNGHGSISDVTHLIMLIEDDKDHAELIIRTIEIHPIPNQVIHFPVPRKGITQAIGPLRSNLSNEK